jgi:hypothetical protein
VWKLAGAFEMLPPVTSWDHLYAEAADRLAQALTPLLLSPDAWMQRRVEHIAISSRQLVRRAVTVDLALPEEGERAELRLDPRDASSPLVVPLGVMRRRS